MAPLEGHHECQVFSGLLPESEESEGHWRECKKNPGHLDFLPASDFINSYLPRVQNERGTKILRSLVDLTVRLRVGYTSLARPDGFVCSDIRGTYVPRVGTGFIRDVWGSEYNKPCECHGRKQWEFLVATALHVVFDSDEALKTVVDVFYDDKESHTDGRMKSVRGVEVLGSEPDRDLCHMRCVTCDEDLGERIESARRSYCDNDVDVPRNFLEDLGLQQFCSKDYDAALIVSHPHGQPKQVTVGQLRYEEKDGNEPRHYTTPTCPGSSGASVFVLAREWNWRHLYSSVHSGSYGEICPEPFDRLNPVKQLNYGHWGRLKALSKSNRYNKKNFVLERDMAYAMHFKSKKIILICEKLILEKLLLNRPQTCKEEGFYNTQKKLELKLYCIKVFQNLYPATSARGEDFTQKYFIFLIFQETQQPCFNSTITSILRNQINVTKLKILKHSLKIKQSKSNSCNYFNESKIEREAESESECQHNDYQDKLRDCAKEGENEIAINKSVHNNEYEIAEKSKEDGKDFNGTDCVKDSFSQQIKTLCNLGGNILDHPGFLIKSQTWNVCIQDTATFNPQNPIDVRGIPWAWLREEKWRLQTFAKYPLNAKKSAILLAEAGFAYIGSGKDSDDTVICFNCKIIKRNWLEFEDIKETHQSMSPTCAMVIGTRGVNIPMIASENVSFGRPQQTNNQNAIDVDCPEAKNHQLSAPRGASNKHRGSFQLATHSVMSPPTAKPQQSQPSHVENRPDLRQASEAGGSSHLVTSNTIPSVSRNNSEERESQGPQQSGSAMSQQSQGAASETGQTNFSSARTVSDSGRNEPGIGNGPSETNTSSTSSARPTSSQSSPTPTSSSNATAVNQSSVPLSVNHSSNTTPYTQSPSSATQSSTATSTTQPPTPATATQSSTTVPSNQSSTPTSNPASVPQNPTYMELGIITERPKRYEYAVRAKRLETFGDWPEGHHLRKEDLADAGYYYAGYGDCARCFYCGGGLRNWEQDDDVWVEHARWFPKCAFIRQRLGQVFIDTVAFLAQTKDKISFMDVVKEMKIDPAAFQIDSKETPLKNDAAVVAVKNMGYREKDILPTAASLKESGQILSADILFTALEEKGVQRLNVSTNMNESNPSMSVNRDKAKDEELLHSLKQTNNDLRLQTLCKICMDKEVAVVFLPCGHLVCCTECAAAMKDCPVCRNQVKGVVRAFMG